MVVKGILLDAHARVLLIRRAAGNRNYAGCWEWPGGKVDPGEDFARALVREMREETGLAVDVSRVAGATEFEMEHARALLVAMEVRTRGGDLRLSEEHDAWEWAPFHELEKRPLPGSVGEFMMEYARRPRSTPANPTGISP